MNAPVLTKRQQAKADTKIAIKSNAAHLFETVGYEAADIRSIAKAAGMSTGAFFATYKDKAAAYRDIYGHDPITPEQARTLADLVRACQGGFSREAHDILDTTVRNLTGKGLADD